MKKWGVCRNARIMLIGEVFALSLTSRIIIKATTKRIHVEVLQKTEKFCKAIILQ